MPLFPMACGTDGWRGIIARELTFDTVGALAEAAARFLREGDHPAGCDPRRVVVGWDRRFLSGELAAEAATRLAEAGFHVLLSDRAVPTPAISLAVRRMRLKGGIVITASHNPARYNGFKFKGHYGGSATPEIYGAIERNIGRDADPQPGGAVELIDLQTPYRQALGERVDLDAIREAGFRVLADPMFGASADGLERIVGRGKTRVVTMRNDDNPGFGGINPEPIPENLGATRERVIAENFDLAIATDGDGDRVGVLGPDGNFVSPHVLLSLFALHLLRPLEQRGDLAKTYSTTLRLDRIAKAHGIRCHETPIGFKHLVPHLESGTVMLAGEESGGIGFGDFLPDRDGLLSGLVLLDLLAAQGKKLPELLAELDVEFGAFAYDRRDEHLPIEAGNAFVAALLAAPPAEVAGEKVSAVRDLGRDGVKLMFGDAANPSGWLLHRVSGTEAMVRLYCEHENGALVAAILDETGKRLERHLARE